VRSWSDFLNDAVPGDHGVHVHSGVDDLATSVAVFLGAGFAAGEPAIVIATRDHRQLFAERLSSDGWDAERLTADGLLVSADAAQTLASCMVGPRVSAPFFETTVGFLIDDVAARFPGKSVRAFGEMVDLLVKRGEPDAAGTLERYWNDLAFTRSFSLLCGYELDVSERRVQEELLPMICSSHEHYSLAAA
jgi:hypothetical protein